MTRSPTFGQPWRRCGVAVGVLAATAVVGLAAGGHLRAGAAAPLTSTTLVLLPTPTHSRQQQQHRRGHPGPHRPQRHHPGEGGRGGRAGSSGPLGGEDGRGVGADEPDHRDRRNLHQSVGGAGAVAGGRGRLRRLRQRNRAGRHLGRAGRPPHQGGRTCRRRSRTLQDRDHLNHEPSAGGRPRLGGRPGARRSCWPGSKTEQADLSLQLDKVKDEIATSAPVGSSASTARSSSRRPRPRVPPPGSDC